MFYEPMVLLSKIENTANFATPVGTWYNIFNKFKGRKRILRQKRLVDGWQPDSRLLCFLWCVFAQYLFPGNGIIVIWFGDKF